MSLSTVFIKALKKTLIKGVEGLKDIKAILKALNILKSV